ncbi:hypothetical protein Htur_0902 [Haloterrigena turkmenica DSM 5511]|uniref:Uncharacterized protein n=1 Tax=Haloterrigena turkmenica (strain ATCC 51198 / DSM 5511 / JCM 9101 / NCIMB 13204 / VKM B-1734 / 4k) TaxID=543526 RepID=D2RXW3_HALTV|nr:hypothetical protein [Haloterrigena turkmenica]ADB59797.1 hypothetical protein Htur_0902 [Haloterrigena turkmenica DSM 5511]
MERVRRTGLVVCFCLAILIVGPVAGAAQQSAAVADGSPAASQPKVDADGQQATACFDAGGTEFVTGSADGTNIWVRLHAGPLTGSGWAIGAELIGSTGGTSIVEVVAGIQFVGDGFLNLLSSPGESIELISGFDFQLPMLEMASSGLGADEAAGSDGGAENESGDSAANESDDGQRGDQRASDSPFEMIRC